MPSNAGEPALGRGSKPASVVLETPPNTGSTCATSKVAGCVPLTKSPALPKAIFPAIADSPATSYL